MCIHHQEAEQEAHKEPVYKKDDFFDQLSCEALERSQVSHAYGCGVGAYVYAVHVVLAWLGCATGAWCQVAEVSAVVFGLCFMPALVLIFCVVSMFSLRGFC